MKTMETKEDLAKHLETLDEANKTLYGAISLEEWNGLVTEFSNPILDFPPPVNNIPDNVSGIITNVKWGKKKVSTKVGATTFATIYTDNSEMERLSVPTGNLGRFAEKIDSIIGRVFTHKKGYEFALA
jgi:hypothetical protein